MKTLEDMEAYILKETGTEPLIDRIDIVEKYCLALIKELKRHKEAVEVMGDGLIMVGATRERGEHNMKAALNECNGLADEAFRKGKAILEGKKP